MNIGTVSCFWHLPMHKKNLSVVLKTSLLFLLFVSLNGYLFFLPYRMVRDSTIASFNDQQLVFAKQAAHGIVSFFDHYQKGLGHLVKHESIVQFNQQGARFLEDFHHVNQDNLLAVTRIDTTGHIMYTVPYNEDAIGRDVSPQPHNAQVMREHLPLISDVFEAVQGYQAVALVMPIFDHEKYAGCLTLLIPFARIAEQYLEDIIIGTGGYAWMISRDGLELSCPVPGHVGKTVFETSSKFPTVIAMADKMMAGEQGHTVYVYDKIKDEQTVSISKHAVYYPVQLPGNLWSIVVATPEKQILASVQKFGRRWLVIFVIFILVLFGYVSTLLRAHISARDERLLLRSEQKYRQSERFLSRFIKDAHIPIAMLNVDGTVEFINTKAQELYGYSLEDLPTMDRWFERAYPDKNECQDLRVIWYDKVREAVVHGVPISAHERTVTCKDGSRKEVAFAFTMVEDRIIMTLVDVTKRNELLRTELELRQQKSKKSKMEAIGLMAGGVAHDLNNILSGIVSYPELLLLQLPDDSPLRHTVEEIFHSGQRAAAVVADLLTVARGAATSRQVADLGALVTQFLDSPEYKKIMASHEHVTLQCQLVTQELLISCSTVHVKKCLMNLVLNGAEAMHDKGVITLSSRTQSVDVTLAAKLYVMPGDYVVLQVHDNGHGIAPKDLERIFEPFFTKKEMGRSGSGLGLAVVWNTMLDHNGAVQVTSDENGTCFTLFFPATSEEIISEISSSVTDLQGHGEFVLVVDDELQQRDIASQMLRTLGYEVESVSSGEDAVVFVKERAVDLLLLDMLMGSGINGRQTFEQIRVDQPQQKAVIASGFAQNKDVKMVLQHGASGFIKKPYTLEELGRAVQEGLRNINDEPQNIE